MYTELYHYLLQHKFLPLPGVGTFSLERKPALGDFPSRIIYSPRYEISYQPTVAQIPRLFFSWLGAIMQVSDREAAGRFNDFTDLTTEQLEKGATIHWKGVGVFHKNSSGEMEFSPDEIALGKPVKAKKVIREKAAHMVRVGEDQKTSEEMKMLLGQQPARRSIGWLWPAVLTMLAILFIGWYLSSKGVKTSSTANNKKPALNEAGKSYRVIP